MLDVDRQPGPEGVQHQHHRQKDDEPDDLFHLISLVLDERLDGVGASGVTVPCATVRVTRLTVLL